MTSADLGSAIDKAVISRVDDVVESIDRESDRNRVGRVVIGIRTRDQPVWSGEADQEVHGHPVRFAACPSVLAVLDALADPSPPSETFSVLVVLTDREPGELGDAVMARLHRERLYDVSKYTLLQDLLRTRQLDPRLRGNENVWLVDALVDLARGGQLPNTAGLTFGRDVALGHVLRNRLAVDPASLDLTRLITAVDDPPTRLKWRSLTEDEHQGLGDHLVDRLGRSAELVVRLATERDDVIAELLVADVLTSTPETDPTAAKSYGAFVHSRFGAREPSRADLAEAASRAVELAASTDTQRTGQQIRRADAILTDLNATQFAHHSRILPSGFAQRLERTAASLSKTDLRSLKEHHTAQDQPTQVDRLRAAVRLQRWLATSPPGLSGAANALQRHARDLAWVDRELTHVRQGSANPLVARALGAIAAKAGARRAELDRQFAGSLSEAAQSCPAGALPVESFLPEVVAPLVRQHKVLLVVVDGMSGSVATEVADSIVDNRRQGWTEIVRSTDGGRESVLAAFPTETTYSRTALLTASLTSGTQVDEQRVFPKHGFWPPRTRAVLVHKAGLGGSAGTDLGAEIDEEFSAEHDRQVLAVVLNTIDDSLSRGRQAEDPSWNYRHVAGLPQLLDRAAENSWIVVLTSDHGHVLEHESAYRPDSTGTARWRLPGTPVQTDEVLLSGRRVLVPGGSAVLAATENVRYGQRSHGYHGGASLGEVAIPLIVLLPPGLDVEKLDGWAMHTMGAPDWWTGRADATVLHPAAAKQAPVKAAKRATKKPPADQPDLFGDDSPVQSRGAQLIASETFVNTHQGQPANRVLKQEVFRDVVDAVLAAGGRLPVADVLQAAGQPGRNPRGLVAALRQVLNIDQFAVIDLIDGGRTVVINQQLLDEQFPKER